MAHVRRRGTIRARLAGILAVPLSGILILLGNLVHQEIEMYGAANEITGAVLTSQTAQNLIDALQNERSLSVGMLSGLDDDRPELDVARVEVDERRGELREVLSEDTSNAAEAQAALSQLDDLAVERAQIDAGRVDRGTAFEYFTSRIDALNHVDVGLDVKTPEPDKTMQRAFLAQMALNYTKEAVSAQVALTLGTAATGKVTTEEHTRILSFQATREVVLAEFGRYAAADQTERVEAAFQSAEAIQMAAYEQVLVAATDGRRLGFSAAEWRQASLVVMDDLHDAQLATQDDLHQRADELRSMTRWELLGLVPIGLVSVAIVIALIIAMSRSIVNPLAALVAEAHEIAARRLPEAVERVQHAEIGSVPERPMEVRPLPRASVEIVSVATAINQMQVTAYTLATEQAKLRQTTVDSLANLGRRTQNLLRRQLNFISQLEREEGDPQALANLFELDHLATRLRRNAESLLVLVGETTPRRWSTPMPLADVVRAAVAEVEDYRRVALRRIDEAYLGGGYVTDVAHMLAELIENGLTFSPPDLDVEIHGRPLGQDYLIAIIDHGIGMSAQDLARANSRLMGEERFTVAPTRFLGHYVVGDLARELSVTVTLVQSPVTGVTARVVIPRTLLCLASDPPAESAAPPARPQAPTPPPALLPGPDGEVLAETIVEAPETVAIPVPLALTEAPEVVETAETMGMAPVVTPSPVQEPSEVTPFGDFVPALSTQQPVVRTRNGLAKRPIRRGIGSAHTPAPAKAPSPAVPLADRKPSEVRSMLTSLRDGVSRGQHGATSPHSSPETTGWFSSGDPNDRRKGDA